MDDAAGWLARLQRDDVAEGDGLAFEAWLAESPENGHAYRAALSVWHEFDAGADGVLKALASPAGRRVAPRAPTRRWLVGAGGVGIAAGLSLAILPSLTSGPAIQTLGTGRGQRQRFTLADGSVVDLNAETRLRVMFERGERRVAMDDGEAIFDVVSDKTRPFIVAAGGRTVRVVGTQFDVRNRQGALTVTVARGKVEVRPSADRVYALTPGQRLEVSAAGLEKTQFVDPAEAFSWRAGRLVYRNEPLSEVVADLNRQFPERIDIGDPELGRIPITGVIVLDDAKSVMMRLSLMLPIRAVPSTQGLLLLRK
ncbi:FecR domain-containing protein [Phenylobacterium sp.]|uniref:FecR family protein n=1 Tax=Phenylobacterium sp. TaxID=1871053 RepID=UPI0035640EB8